MTRPCKVGVQLPEVERFVPWPEYLDLAQRAESAGFDSIWVGDHLIYDLPDGSTRGPYEAWTTLAAITAATERVGIGLLVASTGFHAPGGAGQAGRDGRRDFAGRERELSACWCVSRSVLHVRGAVRSASPDPHPVALQTAWTAPMDEPWAEWERVAYAR